MLFLDAVENEEGEQEKKVGTVTAARPNLDVELDLHTSHCAFCYRSRCGHYLSNAGPNSLPGQQQRCEVVQCRRCGVGMHQCKLTEHSRDICSETQVPCLNANNGCDLKIKRRLLGQHLSSCPASVVVCSVEWNRWPLHYNDHHSPLPFFLPNPQGTPDQLDMAFGMRDQAMLNAAYDAPKHFRRMRNDLTERFPAVPLPHSRQVPEIILRERNEHLAATESSRVAALGTLSRDASVESDSHSNFTSEEDYSWSDAPWQKRRNPPGLSRSLCSKLYQASRQTTDSLKAALQMITEGHGNDHEDDKTSRDVESVCGDFFEEDLLCIAQEEQMEITELTEAALNADGKGSPQLNLDGIEVDVEVVEATIPPPPPPHMPISLGINLTVETITRYQIKPKSMLTFVCGQLFRRDEYAAHYRNVHSEIHGGLTWIEQRCPLAQYGCPFSLRRMNPSTPAASVFHSPDLQSFGLRYPEHCSSHLANPGEDLLSTLPDEIVLRILPFLDGFALNNVSRVNRRLRFLCLQRLQKQGMVTQEWTKIGHGRWIIGFQRWLFSTAFEEVEKWVLGDESVGEHLRKCPFYRRVRCVLPVELPQSELYLGTVGHVSAHLLLRMAENAKKSYLPVEREEVVFPVSTVDFSNL